MPRVLGTKWWGWGSRDESARFPAPSALWKFLGQKLGPLASNPPTGSLDEILELLENNAIIVSIFDQFTIRKFGVVSEFFGHPASTFKSLAILAQATGSPVIPASSWREKDGAHVLRFEEPIPFIEAEKSSEVIRRNTKNYNAALEKIILRHPEQWIWMHKRWKALPPRKQRK